MAKNIEIKKRISESINTRINVIKLLNPVKYNDKTISSFMLSVRGYDQIKILDNLRRKVHGALLSIATKEKEEKEERLSKLTEKQYKEHERREKEKEDKIERDKRQLLRDKLDPNKKEKIEKEEADAKKKLLEKANSTRPYAYSLMIKVLNEIDDNNPNFSFLDYLRDVLPKIMENSEITTLEAGDSRTEVMKDFLAESDFTLDDWEHFGLMLIHIFFTKWQEIA